MKTKLPAVLLALSAVAMVALTLEAKSLRTSYSALVSTSDGPLPGRWYPMVPVQTLGGEARCIGAPEGVPQVLYFFHAGCEECAGSLQVMEETFGATSAASQLAAPLGIGLGTDSSTFRGLSEGVAPEIAILADTRWRGVFRLDTLPQMILIDRGRIRVARGGALNEIMVRDSLVPLLETLAGEERGDGIFDCSAW